MEEMMTDREKLIEEAASAIWLVRYGARVGWVKPPEDWRTRIGPQVEDEIHREAEAALAVFEKAQGEPSDAQVLAALNARWKYDPPYDDIADWSVESIEIMRAALRAAGGVR